MSAHRRPHAHRRVIAAAVATATVGAALTTGVATGASAATGELRLPTFTVTQEGLTADDGARLAEAFRVPNALRGNGAFSFTDPTEFQRVPLKAGGTASLDESKRRTTPQVIDFAALERVKPAANDVALRQANTLLGLAGLSEGLAATPSVSHSELTITDPGGKVTRAQELDTTVSYQLSLAGFPVSGQGAKLRLTVGPDGTVTQVTDALRKVEKADEVPVISPEDAAATCAELYGPQVKQDVPTLGYQFPELGAQEANGKGSVRQILPQYTCNPLSEATEAHRLVPAVSTATPSGKLEVTRSGEGIKAAVSVEGGTGPYQFRWSSSSTPLVEGADGSAVTYTRKPREAQESDETTTVEITDANGLSATAAVTATGDGSVSVASTPGGGGFGVLAVGPNDVGIENMVEEWQCAQDSADGYKNAMASHGVGTAFDFRGANAWESDFKDPTIAGGNDSSYVDNIDAQWYTGHGWSGGFTFDTAHTDTSIVPSDARWGDRDLEWMQLESCQVLADTSGTNDYFGRWRQAFNGLHMLNGFHTNAYCVGGGTGGTFANYLFPEKFLWWTLRPAYRVQTAWASMAVDREPSGVVYRSMGLISPTGVTNIGDYFWGQGSTGPDIPLTANAGMWSITGTV